MISLYECYNILGVSVGAGIADVTNSYRRLCRMHHPDINDDPQSEELMKSINMAYSVLREKFKREAALRDRFQYTRQPRRYAGHDFRDSSAEKKRKADKETEKEAFSALQGYFEAIETFDYQSAYKYLCSQDRRKISKENFVQWRRSVARLFPMLGFFVGKDSVEEAVVHSDGKLLKAVKFRVAVTEEDAANGKKRTTEVDKTVVCEKGVWKVFLGYKNIGELTRSFERQFESGRKRDISERWEEYYSGLCPEYNMLSLTGLKKAASREIYRQSRFGGAVTFAVISINSGCARKEVQEYLQSIAAKTICSVLRETDLPAFAEDGVFALLLVGLQRRNAKEIIARITERIRKNAGMKLGAGAEIDSAHETWEGKGSAKIEAMSEVLRKFGKKF